MKHILIVVSILLSANLLSGQPKEILASENNTSIYGELAVNTSPEIAWKAIKENYGHVGNHHKGIKYGYVLNEQVPFHYGTVRHHQMTKTEYTRESIIAYDEANKTYTTLIYEAGENTLPIYQQKVGISNENGQTYVYQKVIYKHANRQEIGKMKKWNRAYLKAYKEVIEEMMRQEPKSKQFQLRLASMLYE